MTIRRVTSMEFRPLVLAVVVVTSTACAAVGTSPGADSPALTAATVATVAPVVDATVPPESTTEPPVVTTEPPPVAVVPPDGPPAPDFTLALGDGRSFTLSEETRPVYMVFWAEW